MTATVYATPADITRAWRSLTVAETDRAEYWIEIASRRIRRRWPDVDARIGDGGDLDPLDVRDVVVPLVIEVLGGPPVPGATAWSESAGSGQESQARSVTLASASPNDLALFTAAMVELFDGPATAASPIAWFPQGGRYEDYFEWKENAP